jgi:hypothetical protein
MEYIGTDIYLTYEELVPGIMLDSGNEMVSIDGWGDDDTILIQNLCTALGVQYVGLSEVQEPLNN